MTQREKVDGRKLCKCKPSQRRWITSEYGKKVSCQNCDREALDVRPIWKELAGIVERVILNHMTATADMTRKEIDSLMNATSWARSWNRCTTHIPRSNHRFLFREALRELEVLETNEKTIDGGKTGSAIERIRVLQRKIFPPKGDKKARINTCAKCDVPIHPRSKLCRKCWSEKRAKSVDTSPQTE